MQLGNNKGGQSPEIDAFIDQIVARAASIRLPELFASPAPETLYRVIDRHGVTTIAVRTADLTTAQLRDVMTFRLAQYLLADQLDRRLIYQGRLEHEPLENASLGDLHVMSGASKTGEILAYMAIEAREGKAPMATLTSPDRPDFPVESVFGWGVYKRLRVLRDLPVDRIREMGRYMKTQMRPPVDDVVIRATAELALAALSLVGSILRHDIDAVIGDIEESAVKRSLEFFHVPFILLRGVVPYAAEGSYGYYNYQKRTRYPFAFLCSDIPAKRLEAVEGALALPGKEALVALLDLRSQRGKRESSLQPHEGLPPLNNVALPQQQLPMAERRQLLELGEWLRDTELFHGLSVPEAAVLGTLLERSEIGRGTYVVRAGDNEDDVYLIQQGTADVHVTTSAGESRKVRELGPRDYFGEIALLAGGPRTADVIATSPLVLLRLSRSAYERYLGQMVEVERDLARMALSRSRQAPGTAGPTPDRT